MAKANIPSKKIPSCKHVYKSLTKTVICWRHIKEKAELTHSTEWQKKVTLARDISTCLHVHVHIHVTMCQQFNCI